LDAFVVQVVIVPGFTRCLASYRRQIAEGFRRCLLVDGVPKLRFFSSLLELPVPARFFFFFESILFANHPQLLLSNLLPLSTRAPHRFSPCCSRFVFGRETIRIPPLSCLQRSTKVFLLFSIFQGPPFSPISWLLPRQVFVR